MTTCRSVWNGVGVLDPVRDLVQPGEPESAQDDGASWLVVEARQPFEPGQREDQLGLQQEASW